MDTRAIEQAIKDKSKVYFCEVRNGVNQVVEAVPVAVYVSGQSVIAGLFLPNGIRVATVEAALIGGDAFEAQMAVSRRNKVIAMLLNKCWEFSEGQIEGIMRERASMHQVPGIDKEQDKGELN